MKVLVLGGYGTVGRALVTDLIKGPDVAQVVVGGRTADRGEKIVAHLNDPKAAFQKIDLNRQDHVNEAVKHFDIVVNAVSREYNLAVMEAALKAGVHYLDLGGMFHVTKQQLKMHETFADAKLTAVLCMGSVPGISNVFAALCAGKMDRVDEIHIRVGSRRGADFSGFNLSPSTQLDEFTQGPVIYENGEFRELEPLSGRGRYRFPDPVEKVEGFYAIHSEVLTIPRSIENLKKVTYWVAFPDETLNKMDALLNWGLTSREPIEIKGTAISPREFMEAFLAPIKPASGFFEEYKALQVEARGIRQGRPCMHFYETVVGSRKDLSLTCSAFWAGVPASIVIQMIGRGEIDRRGVFPPETIVPAERLMEELAHRGIYCTEKTINPQAIG